MFDFKYCATRCNTCDNKTPEGLKHFKCSSCKDNPNLKDNYIAKCCCNINKNEKLYTKQDIEKIVVDEVKKQINIKFIEEKMKNLGGSCY